MKSKNKIHKGEKALIEMGYYVVLPINLCILLTPNEQVVLNVIRHCKNMGKRYISNSTMQISTGLSENTVRKARNTLIKLGFIEQVGSPTTIGIEYRVNYSTMCSIVEELNNTRNPIERLIKVDAFRGEELAIHAKAIENFKNSEIDN